MWRLTGQDTELGWLVGTNLHMTLNLNVTLEISCLIKAYLKLLRFELANPYTVHVSLR